MAIVPNPASDCTYHSCMSRPTGLQKLLLSDELIERSCSSWDRALDM